jgi:DNA polymerase-1
VDWLNRFDSVWSIDFEYSQPPGERPRVVCLVAREFFSKRLIRVGMEELATMRLPPFETSDKSLLVAYYSSAEWNCFLALGWPMPARVLDLWCEFKNQFNGGAPVAGHGLLGCLAHHGCDSITVAEKEEMRQLAMTGGPYSASQMASLLDYCQSDVDALDRLLPRMTPNIDFPRALLRGRYMCAVARMEHTGIPVDMDTLRLFRKHWTAIKTGIVDAVDVDFGVYDGFSFNMRRFANYLIKNNIPWPVTDTGVLEIKDKTFREQARSFPKISPLRELRYTLSAMKLEDLSIGSDGRNRSKLSPFSSRTGRNQPSNNKFIFGPSVWLRGLIKPAEGMSLAYIDWSQQELGIAAALSGDKALVQAYRSGDPYLEFAKMAGAVPASATKQSHPNERAAYKTCMLATLYGMTEHGLAARLNQPLAAARNLLRSHREKFPTFWHWSQGRVDTAMLVGEIKTVFGWTIHTQGADNERSLANFTMQANGAEMMRLACSMATEAGIAVCCPVHDAILIEAPTESIEAIVRETQAIMREASRIVLGDFELDSDAKIISFPDRYMDEDRGRVMWDRVVELALAAERESGTACPKIGQTVPLYGTP